MEIFKMPNDRECNSDGINKKRKILTITAGIEVIEIQAILIQFRGMEIRKVKAVSPSPFYNGKYHPLHKK